MIPPKDNAMLLSFLNLKLRDSYSSFGALCDDLELDGDKVLAQMKSFGYAYDEAQNRFVPQEFSTYPQ